MGLNVKSITHISMIVLLSSCAHTSPPHFLFAFGWSKTNFFLRGTRTRSSSSSLRTRTPPREQREQWNHHCHHHHYWYHHRHYHLLASQCEGVLPKGDNKWHLLPRLYVGKAPKMHRIVFGDDDDNENSNRSSSLVELLEPHPRQSSRRLLSAQARIPLTEDQSHYLTSVLRIFHHKRKKKMITTSASNATTATNEPLVRLFDGCSGEEWLARIVDPITDEDDLDDDHSKKKNKKKKRHETLLEAECLSLLRSLSSPPPQSSTATSDTTVTGTSTTSASPPPSCLLCVPVPSSKDRWRFLLEKSTELGVHGIVLLETDFSSSSSKESASSKRSFLDKAVAHLVEASEQCERLTLPTFVQIGKKKQLLVESSELEKNSNDESPDSASSLTVTTRLRDLLEFVVALPKNNHHDLKLLICRERATLGREDATTGTAGSNNLLQVLLEIQKRSREKKVEQDDEEDDDEGGVRQTNNNNADAKEKNKNVVTSTSPPLKIIAYCIGPEGGWSADEEALMDRLQAQQQSLFPGSTIIYNVSLGPTILRVETAAVAALAVHSVFFAQ